MVDEKKTIGAFQFQLPTDSKIRTYKINYSTNGSGFISFIQQQKLDSLQITAIENPALDLKLNYKKHYLEHIIFCKNI